MELKLGSDDDLFGEEKDRTLKERGGWAAKQCESEWFMEDVIDASCHSSEEAQLLSYQADLLFSKKQFCEALVVYRKGIQILASRYVLLRRILIEGASRCCMYLQDHEQALHFAEMLLEESLTLEHRMIAHRLLASVRAAAGNQHDAIRSLHLCVQCQRSNVQFWLKLSAAYSALYSQSTHEAYTGHVRCGLITDGLNGSDPTPVLDRGSSLRESPKTRKSCDKARSSLKRSKANSEDTMAESVQNDPRQSGEEDVCNNGEQEQCEVHVKGHPGDGASTVIEMSTHTDFSRSDEDHRTETLGVQGDLPCIRDLLNAFDKLAMVSDAKPNCEAVVGTLNCRGCQPLLYAASCLLRARLLLKSVEHSVNSFAKVKNSRLQNQVDEHLSALNLDRALLKVLHHHARQIFRKGFKKLDGDASGDDKEEDAGTDDSNLSSEIFEKRWFQWDIR